LVAQGKIGDDKLGRALDRLFAVDRATWAFQRARSDLKQLVYSLCVTSDGAVPVHFKAYAGNQTDNGIHLETWNRLRTLLQRPRFIYVADCKLCTEKNLRRI